MLTRRGATRTLRLFLVTVEAWLALVAFDVALAVGFKRAHERVRRCRTRPGPVARLAASDIVWAVEEACVWYVKRALCLQRSAVAVRLLRRHGISAELVIGYRPVPFESHAWVEVDGVVVNDRPQYQKVFGVLDRL